MQFGYIAATLKRVEVCLIFEDLAVSDQQPAISQIQGQNEGKKGFDRSVTARLKLG